MRTKTNAEKVGKPIFFIPLRSAKIVASEIGLDSYPIAAALLHDVVVEDTSYTLVGYRAMFGETVMYCGRVDQNFALNTQSDVSASRKLPKDAVDPQ